MLLDGFTPAVGNSFDLFDWGNVVGTFSSVSLPAIGAGLRWNTSQLYATGVISVAPSFSADFDDDGDVDGDDLAQWRGDFAGPGSDADDDGDSDGADFLLWQQQFGSIAAVAAAQPAAGAVPEPSGAALVLIVAGLIARRRTRLSA